MVAMPFIEWDQSFVTGVQQFDEHHKHLVGLINKTHDDFICGAPDESLEVILSELVSYAGYHFTAEETWMLEHSYPQMTEHKNEHAKFTKTVLEFQAAFHERKANISLEVLTFLKRWLNNHIFESDAAYGRFNAAV
jgi:hemerythrin